MDPYKVGPNPQPAPEGDPSKSNAHDEEGDDRDGHGS